MVCFVRIRNFMSPSFMIKEERSLQLVIKWVDKFLDDYVLGMLKT